MANDRAWARMSNLFRHLLSAEQVVATLLRDHPEDEAMARAVGGDYERFGVLEHAVLREIGGLRPGSSVVDVGCGSGRLATRLARLPALRYLGTDVVPQLLEYARKRAARPDFRFIHVDRVNIPAPDASADIVCFFSVLTHLLHEESYLYLQEAHRVLKPGGRVVFSFLEYDTPVGWSVFEANLDWVRTRVIASQINVFLPRPVIRHWAERLGFRVTRLRDGKPGSVTVEPGEATPEVVAGRHSFGQSLCVLRKPLPGEATPDPAARAEQRRTAMAALGRGPGSLGQAPRMTPPVPAGRPGLQAPAAKTPQAARGARPGPQRPVADQSAGATPGTSPRQPGVTPGSQPRQPGAAPGAHPPHAGGKPGAQQPARRPGLGLRVRRQDPTED